MSAFWVGKLIYTLQHNPQLSQQFREDPDPVMEQFPLTDEEKDALRRKDVKFLFELGVNPYMIAISTRHLGLKQEEAISLMAGAGDHPFLPSVWFPDPPAEGGDYLIKTEKSRA